MKCAVLNCLNRTGVQKKSIDGTGFHAFPSDMQLKNAWTQILNRSEWTPTKHSIICSIHFNQSDFYKTKKGFNKLRPGALPKLFLDDQKSVVTETTEPSQSNHGQECLAPRSPTPELEPFLIFHDTPKDKMLKREIKLLKFLLSKKNKKIKQLQERNRRLKKKILSIRKMLDELKEKKILLSSDAEVLNSINLKARELVEMQIKKKSGQPISKQWSSNLRTFALTLNFYSPKAYEYVRDTFDSCLPHPKTLAKWHQSVDGKPGLTSE